jgi:hypothetical protein
MLSSGLANKQNIKVMKKKGRMNEASTGTTAWLKRRSE